MKSKKKFSSLLNYVIHHTIVYLQYNTVHMVYLHFTCVISTVHVMYTSKTMFAVTLTYIMRSFHSPSCQTRVSNKRIKNNTMPGQGVKALMNFDFFLLNSSYHRDSSVCGTLVNTHIHAPRTHRTHICNNIV